MNRLNFKDRRGDEYTFLRYNTNDVRVTKRSKVSDGSHQIDLSAEAVEKLETFLDSEGT